MECKSGNPCSFIKDNLVKEEGSEKVKRYFVSISFLIIFTLSACDIGENPQEHLDEIYTLALDTLMKNDAALNEDMKFIAIDMRNFNELSEEEKKEILDYFKEKYHVKAMAATASEMKKEGYFNPDTNSYDGVLLKIEKIDIKFTNNVNIEGSKIRSGNGAIGLKLVVHYKGGAWKLKEMKEIWVS